jgi:hypothetical protein
MGRENDINGIAPSRVVIAPGATNSRLIQPIAGEISSGLKYFSGGSLEIVQAPLGTTLSGTQLIATSADNKYLISNGEVLNFDGGVRYYLMATGATTIAYIMRGLSTGF